MRLIEIAVPKPLEENILDAIEHASTSKVFVREDFALKYEGVFTVEQLRQFDDIDSWIETDDIDDLDSFRDGSWNAPKHDVPPIIVITTPDEGKCHTQIGDGRGRVNYANVHGMKLHVWHLIHKKCM